MLDQIFADESDPEDSDSSYDENASSGSEFQVESGYSDSEEADDDGRDDDEQSEVEDGDVENTSESDDDDILYSIAENASFLEQPETTLGQVGGDDCDERRAGHSFLSKSSTERWLVNAPTARQARIENIIKGHPGPTSYAKQRVSADNSVVDSFLVFFSQRMLQHVTDCTNREGCTVKQEDWNAMSVVELKAFLGLLLLRGVYRATGESTEELWSADGRQDFAATMSFNRLVQCLYVSRLPCQLGALSPYLHQIAYHFMCSSPTSESRVSVLTTFFLTI